MRFWEDMQTKFGFNDGEAIPDGVDIYRSIYIRAVNRLAEKLNSQVRVAAYDRCGVHNFYLIVTHNLNDLVGYEGDLTEHTDLQANEADADEAMEEAISQAQELDLDNYVQVEVSLSDDFEDFVTHLRPVNDNEPLVIQVNGQAQHIVRHGQVQLMRDVAGFGTVPLLAGSTFIVQWIDHRASLLGLATSLGTVVAIASSHDVIVVDTQAEE